MADSQCAAGGRRGVAEDERAKDVRRVNVEYPTASLSRPSKQPATCAEPREQTFLDRDGSGLGLGLDSPEGFAGDRVRRRDRSARDHKVRCPAQARSSEGRPRARRGALSDRESPPTDGAATDMTIPTSRGSQ